MFNRSALYPVLFLLFSISGVQAQEVIPRRLDGYLNSLAKLDQFSGAALAAQDGKIIYEKSFGYADLPAKAPNNINTLFPIASISKTLTATAILQLMERGKLNVNDPVVKCLPEFPYPQVTIRHLLSHTSGLPPYNAFFAPVLAEDSTKIFVNADFLPAAAKYKPALLYQPGESANYDNVNYLVLAIIVEKLSGMPFADYMQEHVLNPAGMSHTRIIRHYNDDQIPDFAYPHLKIRFYDETPVIAKSLPYIKSYWKTFGLLEGFADYSSTLDDLLLYDQALYKGTLLKPETMQMTFKPVKLNNGDIHPALFGLCWESESDSSMGVIVYHTGGATGLNCILMRNITTRQTVILYDNMHSTAHETGLNMMKILNGQHVKTPAKSIAQVYGITLLKEGTQKAKALLEELKKDTLGYYLSEEEMNRLGYDFLGKNNTYHLPESPKYDEALETFKLNTELFPESWNVYDSFGEALLAAGRADEAAAMYEKSLQLNPKNNNGRKILESLEKQTGSK
jgi:CubicO group peptidase (beta-lactamase class C family)